VTSWFQTLLSNGVNLYRYNLAMDDVDGNCDYWDSVRVVPAAEEARLREFIASLSEHRNGMASNSVVVPPVLVLAVAANAVNVCQVVASVEATLSAVLDQRSGLQRRRRPFSVKLLQSQPPLLSNDRKATPAAVSAVSGAWDTLLEDGGAVQVESSLPVT
jgi:hypothetical protein